MLDASPAATADRDVFFLPDAEGKIRFWLEKAQDKNGFHLLKTGGDALAARLAVIQLARETLDLQYYVLQGDLTGKLIIEEMLRAADRGVRIRVLLDDLDFGRAKEVVCILNIHDNISFRIFNPASTRRQRLLFRVSKWSRTLERYTKRMHNKALIADGKLGVVGGRNLGDEYFDAAEEFAFSDLDVMLMGPVMKQLNSCFDEYWDSKPSLDLKQIGCDDISQKTYMVHRIALRAFYDDVAHMKVISKRKPEDYITAICNDELPRIWAEAEFAADAPEKVLKPIEQADSPPMRKLESLMMAAKREVVVVSPYMIPAEEGMQVLQSLHERGVSVRALTNSLASTDISAVHAVYSRYRPEMLQYGAELYELKPIPGKRTRSNLFRRKAASRSSLHAKVYVIDREYTVIGSMNFDPRSRLRNTEVLVAIRSEEMAAQVLKMFDDITAPATSYRVQLDAQGKMEWLSEKDGKAQRFHHDPSPGMFRRIWTWIFYHTAPESQL